MKETVGNVKDGAKGTLIFVVCLTGFALVATLVIYLTGGVKQITASFRGETAEKERTVADGAFRVTSYEKFFDLCSAIQAKEARIRNTEAQLDRMKDTLTPFDEERLNGAVLANQNQRAELITQYNALTSNKFRSAYLDAGLPTDIDETNPTTECK